MDLVAFHLLCLRDLRPSAASSNLLRCSLGSVTLSYKYIDMIASLESSMKPHILEFSVELGLEVLCPSWG